MLGGLLLAAAGLKLYGLSVSAVPRVGWFAQPWVQLAAVEWEAILGVWLLSGAHQRGSWLAAVGTFLAFAGVSGYLGWVGVASCGCFGARQASPWYAFAVDITALLLLSLSRPPVVIGPPHTRGWFLRNGLLWSGGVAVLVGLAALATSAVGSVEVLRGYLRGETLSVSDRYIDFGFGRSGDVLERTASVRNLTDRPVRLIGGTSDCSCTVLGDLPVTVEPGGTAVISVHLHVPTVPRGGLTRTVVIHTDCPKQQVVKFRIGCRVE